MKKQMPADSPGARVAAVAGMAAGARAGPAHEEARQPAGGREARRGGPMAELNRVLLLVCAGVGLGVLTWCMGRTSAPIVEDWRVVHLYLEGPQTRACAALGISVTLEWDRDNGARYPSTVRLSQFSPGQPPTTLRPIPYSEFRACTFDATLCRLLGSSDLAGETIVAISEALVRNGDGHIHDIPGFADTKRWVMDYSSFNPNGIPLLATNLFGIAMLATSAGGLLLAHRKPRERVPPSGPPGWKEGP